MRADWLAHWINGDCPNAQKQQSDRERVEKIVTLLQKLKSHLRPGTPVGKTPEVGKTEAELLPLTRRYQTWPRFGAESDGTGIGIAHMWEGGFGSLDEAIALSLVQELVKTGLLSNLTFCESCKRHWVFRNGKKGKYCSTNCRQAPYEQRKYRQKRKSLTARLSYWTERVKDLRGKLRIATVEEKRVLTEKFEIATQRMDEARRALK
jgi:hypothetical protein